jgi:hypothetical protein
MKILSKPLALVGSLLLALVLLALSGAAASEPPQPPLSWEAAAGEDVVTPRLHPSTLERSIAAAQIGRPQNSNQQEPKEAPSFLRDVATSRHLQQEDSSPSYLFVQMADGCIFQRTSKGNVVLKSRHFHGSTVRFSDRPFTYEDAVPTESFFADFPDFFNGGNGGMPNAAIALVQDGESKDVVVSTFARAVVKRGEEDDPDGPATYGYKLEQSDEQASVVPLADILGGEDKVVYDHCSIFIDGASPCLPVSSYCKGIMGQDDSCCDSSNPCGSNPDCSCGPSGQSDPCCCYGFGSF